MPRKPPRNTPLFRNTRCLATISGESGDSGHNPSLEGRAKNAFHRPFTNDFSAEENVAPDLDSGFDKGRFSSTKRFARPLTRRETHSLRPPISKNLSCLVTILGETGESRRNHGLDG